MCFHVLEIKEYMKFEEFQMSYICPCLLFMCHFDFLFINQLYFLTLIFSLNVHACGRTSIRLHYLQSMFASEMFSIVAFSFRTAKRIQQISL